MSKLCSNDISWASPSLPFDFWDSAFFRGQSRLHMSALFNAGIIPVLRTVQAMLRECIWSICFRPCEALQRLTLTIPNSFRKLRVSCMQQGRSNTRNTRISTSKPPIHLTILNASPIQDVSPWSRCHHSHAPREISRLRLFSESAPWIESPSLLAHPFSKFLIRYTRSSPASRVCAN
jgi:hypothetical protein